MATSATLFETSNAVVDSATFLTFVRTLIADREEELRMEEANPSPLYALGRGANGWENGSIAAFLEAAVAWAEASEFGKNPNGNAWREFSSFLYAGKIYE